MKARGLAFCSMLALAGCGTYRVADDPAINASEMARQNALAEKADRELRAEAAAAKAACDRKGGVRVGMTRDQVYASCWGKPQRINSTIVAGSKHDQLVYGLSSYVYLDDGVVTAIQTREK